MRNWLPCLSDQGSLHIGFKAILVGTEWNEQAAKPEDDFSKEGHVWAALCESSVRWGPVHWALVWAWWHAKQKFPQKTKRQRQRLKVRWGQVHWALIQLQSPCLVAKQMQTPKSTRYYKLAFKLLIQPLIDSLICIPSFYNRLDPSSTNATKSFSFWFKERKNTLKRQRDKKTKRQKDLKTKRLKTERQKNWKTYKIKDKQTKRQNYLKTKILKDFRTKRL